MNKKYFGAQTEAAVNNFPFSCNLTAVELIYSIAQIKKAAAIANHQAGKLDSERKHAIVQASDELLTGNFNSQFLTSALQGGAGTSINMNVNEVIGSRATEILGGKTTVHPNDHVNMSQSTNDVNPSALKIAILDLSQELLKTLDILVETLEKKAQEFSKIQKLARTHLQDAIPTTLGAEFQSYADVIKTDQDRIIAAMKFFYVLNLGGTAIGNAINADKIYREYVYTELAKITKLPLKPAKNLMSQTSSQTDFLMFSQTLVTLTLDISKIASDLRLLSSGPKGGLAEINLRKLQAGSSIMPGKANPILAESVNQLYFMVSGNNLTIEHAAHASQLELGVMLPILADRLISSIKLSTEVIANFAENCVLSVTANEERCKELLESSTAYATLLTPLLGYDLVSKVVEKSISSGKTIREVIAQEKLLTESEFEKAVKL